MPKGDEINEFLVIPAEFQARVTGLAFSSDPGSVGRNGIFSDLEITGSMALFDRLFPDSQCEGWKTVFGGRQKSARDERNYFWLQVSKFWGKNSAQQKRKYAGNSAFPKNSNQAPNKKKRGEKRRAFIPKKIPPRPLKTSL